MREASFKIWFGLKHERLKIVFQDCYVVLPCLVLCCVSPHFHRSSHVFYFFFISLALLLLFYFPFSISSSFIYFFFQLFCFLSFLVLFQVFFWTPNWCSTMFCEREREREREMEREGGFSKKQKRNKMRKKKEIKREWKRPKEYKDCCCCFCFAFFFRCCCFLLGLLTELCLSCLFLFGISTAGQSFSPTLPHLYSLSLSLPPSLSFALPISPEHNHTCTGQSCSFPLSLTHTQVHPGFYSQRTPSSCLVSFSLLLSPSS